VKKEKSNWKRQRIIGRFEPFERVFYIFCEGEQTEPNYFNGIKKHIEENPIYKNKIFIMVEGVGAETLQVLDHAVKFVSENSIKDADVWLVYDKDSFPPERFNSVVTRVKDLNERQHEIKYFTAWSNQCIEYWFILHFDYYVSDNDRNCYKRYLNRKFRDLGLRRYQKRDPEIYEKLMKNGNPELAIRYAERRLGECPKRTTPAQMAPATTVHELYRALKIYLPQEN